MQMQTRLLLRFVLVPVRTGVASPSRTSPSIHSQGQPSVAACRTNQSRATRTQARAPAPTSALSTGKPYTFQPLRRAISSNAGNSASAAIRQALIPMTISKPRLRIPR